MLYEGVVSEFLARYPGLDPAWDEEWRRHTEGCVDIWIKWSESDNSLQASLEHWEIRELAERYGDESSAMELDTALKGPGENRGAGESAHRDPQEIDACRLKLTRQMPTLWAVGADPRG